MLISRSYLIRHCSCAITNLRTIIPLTAGHVMVAFALSCHPCLNTLHDLFKTFFILFAKPFFNRAVDIENREYLSVSVDRDHDL